MSSWKYACLGFQLWTLVFLRHEKQDSQNGKNSKSVFTHVASIYANLLEQKKAFALEKSSTPTGLVWDTNMAAVSLFWDTNMAAVTLCENTP